MYKLSVTTIEKYRRYTRALTQRDNEHELLQSIKGIFEGNDMTQVGEAYHKIIEGEALVMDNGLQVELQRDGRATAIFFTPEQAEPALAFRDAHPTMIHEISIQKVYQTKYGPILVKGRLDGQEGLETEDKKCKFGQVNFQDYLDSYQWRFYLDILGTDSFYYDIFEVRGFDGLNGAQPYRLPGVTFHAHDRLQCFRYQYMGYDCLSLLNDFLDYVELRQLWQFLKQAPELVTI